ncbi:MAG: EamA family transporter RarD [Deltaproteobacteria bacterium]|nr:EamA family transporter RarD [Myxococcales bacterium]MDP3220311.1 EamA family transporter RarD [Deltaproteobacteria bacterium]
MPPRRAAPTGLLFAIAAYGAWGVIPLYWRLLSSVSPVEILAHRVAWSLVFVAALVLAMGARAELLRALRDRRTRAMLAASSVLIGVNWVVFIGSIQAHRLSEASLGYFINPLVNVALGVVVFREHLRAAQRVSITLALLGVGILVASSPTFPWIALVLAGTFAAYGLLRKLAPVPATVGLLVETLLLSPLALGYLAHLASSRAGAFALGPVTLALLALSGPLTALPLVWFARAARAMPLATLGIVQYLAPTLQFLIAVFVFAEAMPATRWAAFGCIWLALGIFSADFVRALRVAAPAARAVGQPPQE